MFLIYREISQKFGKFVDLKLISFSYTIEFEDRTNAVDVAARTSAEPLMSINDVDASNFKSVNQEERLNDKV